ncbi:alpha/beta fold hydrolase [Pseudomonas sp. GL-B-19]|uniref:alpha/beta fold hydrolase n=1 Tax=Pseudomonas sp. GL-B-19 TaxID=2832393 RepID=UPI001CBE4D2F|nr:alpha/beta hydrolase [Pseudomonas sp. GL-B-19]
MNRLTAVAFLLCASFSIAHAAERWETLPATPQITMASKSAYLDVNGAKIFYRVIGHGSPVVLLHGGLANSDYWGNQVNVLAPHHTVILLDSRGHGRSGRDAQAYGYDLMADDVVAVLDHLKIHKADVVGWSDGGILGLDLAMRHPDRVGKIFAFAANSKTSGVIQGVEKNPTFAAYIDRAGQEYKKLSKTPDKFDEFVEQISHMWASQPGWSDADLKTIKTPVLIVDGDHDEAINREHTEYLAATIPGAGLAILPNASHFAFMQAPADFNAIMLNFLGQK